MNSQSTRPQQSAGKQVGDTLYLHVSAVCKRDEPKQQAIAAATRIARIGLQAFNVVKLSGRQPNRISLLAYEGFDNSPFPALLDSWTADIEAGTCVHRSYRSSQNPPILHRKELLLPLDDPRRETFSRLTRSLENRGLFADPKAIGFRRQWETRLRKAELAVIGHRLVDAKDPRLRPKQSDQPIKRFRTAIVRSRLSAPMQALERHGLLEGNHSVFDFGCGRGDDIAALAAVDVRVSGWDPHYAPEAAREESDVVNLGFVLNVIEDSEERIAALQEAYALSRRVLSVAVMVAGREDTTRLQPHRDGFLSTRGTFQKYFTQGEIRVLIENTTHQEAIPVAPGVFFVFRDKILEQEFLADRYRRRSSISLPKQSEPLPSKRPSSRTEAVFQENQELMEEIWSRATQLGRLPFLDELQDSVGREILERLGSMARASRVASAVYNAEDLSAARQIRTDDMTVYLALNLFGARKRYRKLPIEHQRDIKAFFGSYATAEQCAHELLFSLANPEVLEEASKTAEEAGIGFLDGKGGFQLDARLVKRLPAELRAYIGCAEQLYGDIGDTNVVKLHIMTRKVSLFKFQNYELSPLPLLRERVKIDLRRQNIHFFKQHRPETTQLLYMKSRYMAKDLPGFARQETFDQKLASFGLLVPDAPEPSLVAFARQLSARGLRIRGFDIVPYQRAGAALDNANTT